MFVNFYFVLFQLCDNSLTTNKKIGIVVPIYFYGELVISFSEGTAIALHSVVYISNKGMPATVKEISTKFGMSENHLSKVLQRLVKEGILNSEKGPRGGFSINSKHKNMPLIEVYEIFEGKFRCHKCLFTNGDGDCEECIMSNFIEDMDKEFIKYMTNKKITDFKNLPNLNPYNVR